MKKHIIFILIFFAFSLSDCFATNQIEFKIEGIQGKLLENVQARLTILNKSHDRSGSIEEQGKLEIKKAMQPLGYFKRRQVFIDKRCARV